MRPRLPGSKLSAEPYYSSTRSEDDDRQVPILTKRVYDPASREDGFRLLTMRLWPRGVKRGHADSWEKELGPSRELLRDFKDEKINWSAFKKRYRQEMKEKPELLGPWRQRAHKETITLLCSCVDENRCHRTLLKELLEK